MTEIDYVMIRDEPVLAGPPSLHVGAAVEAELQAACPPRLTARTLRGSVQGFDPPVPQRVLKVVVASSTVPVLSQILKATLTFWI